MKERIEKVIDYATHGNTARFADSVGWSRQYINNVLAGRRGVGIVPVQKVLRTYPDISARWLLLGEGAMLRSASQTMCECIYALMLSERTAHDAKDLQRTARTMERLAARLTDENRTKTAQQGTHLRNAL